MKYDFKKNIDSIKIVFLGVLLAGGLNYAHAQWTGPSQAAPNGNVPAPINVGASAQNKNGRLGVNMSTLPDASYALQANGAIGAASMTVSGNSVVGAGLTVGTYANIGDYIIVNSGGTQLRLENNGSSGPRIQSYNNSPLYINTLGNNVIFNMNGGNVGIGTSPSFKLDVAGSIRAQGLQIGTGAASGRVLTSDASGNATWQPGATVLTGSVGISANLGPTGASGPHVISIPGASSSDGAALGFSGSATSICVITARAVSGGAEVWVHNVAEATNCVVNGTATVKIIR